MSTTAAHLRRTIERHPSPPSMTTRWRPPRFFVATLLPLCALPLCALALCALALPGAARAQDSAAIAPVSLVGEWRGTSICTPVGKPACHDEQVVYRVRRAAAAGGDSTVERLEWVMNK